MHKLFKHRRKWCAEMLSTAVKLKNAFLSGSATALSIRGCFFTLLILFGERLFGYEVSGEPKWMFLAFDWLFSLSIGMSISSFFWLYFSTRADAKASEIPN